MIRISIAYRLTLARLLMLMLIAATIGTGLWFASVTQENIQIMREGTNQAVGISDLQQNWLSVVGTLDAVLLSEPSPEAKVQLQSQLDQLSQQTTSLTDQLMGFTPETITENQFIVQELQRLDVETSVVADQIYTLMESGKTSEALEKRRSELSELQINLDDNLNRLNSNLQEDFNAQLVEIQRQQNLLRTYWITTIVVALILALGLGWLIQRTMVQPINQLNTDVQRIAGGDFSPVTPLKQDDEIGDLSRALALMTAWLAESYQALEKRVAERTQDLERRTAQLQAAAEVGRDITATRDLDALLNHAVNLIHDRFDFYHAGIFLTDASNEYAVLRAATGQAGQQLLESGHRLKVGETGLVGFVCQAGKSRIALDVGQDAVHFKNPLLPETRSEAALPLRIGEQVIGALDVQSREPAAFDEGSLVGLEVMADQLAIAIQNARLLQDTQTTLSELEAAYGRIDRQAWDQFIQSAPTLGYQFDGFDVTTIEETDSPTTGPRPLSIPLQVRGQMIGALDVWSQEQDLSDDDIYLLTTVSSRIGQVLESARLYEQAQRLAHREQLTSEITARIRETLDIETVLRTAVQEIQNTLGAPEVVISLAPSSGTGSVVSGVGPDETPDLDLGNDGHHSRIENQRASQG